MEQLGLGNVSPATDAAEHVQATVCTPRESWRKKGARYACFLFFKRAFDIVSAATALILLAPILLIILLVKWLEDFHNPVYVSTRVGKDGRHFRFYKIRSMRPDAEAMKADMIRDGMNEVDGPVFKIKDDPRITRFGKLLRRTSIDELLQLFNVLNGTMSVVGPRPPIPCEVEDYTDEQMHRLDVKGGLLCLWQIQPDRHAVSFEDWVQLDLEYIKKQSALLDLKIIFKGAMMIFSGKSGD